MSYTFITTIQTDICKEEQRRHHTDRLTKTTPDPELDRHYTGPTTNMIKKLDGGKKSNMTPDNEN
jgi:hypothetical protein